MNYVITGIVSFLVSFATSFLFWKLKRKHTLQDVKNQDLKNYHNKLSEVSSNLEEIKENINDADYTNRVYNNTQKFLTIYNHNKRLIKHELKEEYDINIKQYIKNYSVFRAGGMKSISIVIKNTLTEEIEKIQKIVNDELKESHTK